MANSKAKEWLKDDKLLQLEAWARDGLTDEQIAKNIGIVPSTLYEWKKKYPEISESLKKGKEVVDIEVENALLKRAKGYSYIEITEEAQYNSDKKKFEMIVTKKVTKQVSPDVGAIAIWLKNRKPDIWKDKPVSKEDIKVPDININVVDNSELSKIMYEEEESENDKS